MKTTWINLKIVFSNGFSRSIIDFYFFKKINVFLDDIITLKKETKTIKDRILRYTKNLFEHKVEENYYKPGRVSNFCSNSYIKYENNSDRNETLSIEEYLNPNLGGLFRGLFWGEG